MPFSFDVLLFLLNRPLLHGPTSSPIHITWYCILLCFVQLFLNPLQWECVGTLRGKQGVVAKGIIVAQQ